MPAYKPIFSALLLGWVDAQAASGLPDATIITNQASIVFDVNADFCVSMFIKSPKVVVQPSNEAVQKPDFDRMSLLASVSYLNTDPPTCSPSLDRPRSDPGERLRRRARHPAGVV